MKLKNQGKRLGGLLFLSLFLAPGVQAKAPSTSKADVSWYANINRALMHVDDGHQKDTYFVDNFSKSSRAGIIGETKLDECLTVGGLAELEFATASTSSVNQLNKNNADQTNTGENSHDGIKIRQVDTWVKGDFGKLSLGHGSTASWTTVASDLSGTADTVGYMGPYGMASGFYFHTKDSQDPVVVGNPRVADVFNPNDGLARKDRVRYDTPNFYGFSLSGSINSGEKDEDANRANVNAGRKYGSDIALRYADTLQGVQLQGAVALYKLSKGSNDKAVKVWDASLAALHQETGINGALQYATKTMSEVNALTNKPKFTRVALGLISDLNHYGPTNFVVDYAHSKNSIANDDKGKGYGLGVVQQLKKVNSEVYFSVKRLKYKLVDDTIPYDHILAVMTGLRVNLGGKLS